MTRFLVRLRDMPWLWSFLGAVGAWLVTMIVSRGQGGGQILTAAFTFSAFTVLVSLGQMLVITTGPGNVDLSIPSTIALSSAVSMLVMNESDARILPGVAAAVAAGATVGLCNYLLIRLLKIPPIIATLSSSLIVMSVAISIGRGLRIKPPDAYAELVGYRLVGIPLLAVVALVDIGHVTSERIVSIELVNQPKSGWVFSTVVPATRMGTRVPSGSDLIRRGR